MRNKGADNPFFAKSVIERDKNIEKCLPSRSLRKQSRKLNLGKRRSQTKYTWCILMYSVKCVGEINKT